MTDIDLDPVIHAQSRLRVMAALAALDDGDRLTFSRLQQLLEMTPGNLSTHIRKLEDARYVVVDKLFEGRSPVTYVALSKQGRRAFETYTESLEALLRGKT